MAVGGMHNEKDVRVVSMHDSWSSACTRFVSLAVWAALRQEKLGSIASAVSSVTEIWYVGISLVVKEMIPWTVSPNLNRVLISDNLATGTLFLQMS